MCSKLKLPRRTLFACLMLGLTTVTSCWTSDFQLALDAIDPNQDLPPDAPRISRSPPQNRQFRTFDGSFNNSWYPELGASHTTLRRLVPPEYADGIASPAGSARPSPRAISNALCDDAIPNPNEAGATDFLWQWGQFLDHDIDLTSAAVPAELLPIAVPAGDPYFDPSVSGTALISFNRSTYHAATGSSTTFPRQQINEITHFIDASQVYGSDEARASSLRTLDGTGKLRVSDGDLLPFNLDGLANHGGTGPELFVAGDVRANEQVGLTAMHTLFVREHNRLAEQYASKNPSLSGDEIYQLARRYVGALMQHISYDEFLPALLGPSVLAPYSGYQLVATPAISNLFSTAIFRFGHSALSPTILRLDANGAPIPQGHLALRDGFFAPRRIIDEGGIEPILRGLAGQACSSIDTEIVDDVRNFLFGPPGSGGLDLAALNIQRGRDHGLPSYNDARFGLGLPVRTSFAEISSDPVTQQRLSSVYESVDDVDVWIGALAEDHVNGGHVGELAFFVIKEQFEALRNGDRFWWERSMPADEQQEIRATTLADVIRRNTLIGAELSDDVFHLD